MDDLRLVDEKNERVLVDIGRLDLIPFQGHAFTGTDLHENLLTADLVGIFLKQYLSLFQLRDPIELYPPEEHVKKKRDDSADKPPYTRNPDSRDTQGQCTQRGDPALLLHDIAECNPGVGLSIEFVILCPYDHNVVSVFVDPNLQAQVETPDAVRKRTYGDVVYSRLCH